MRSHSTSRLRLVSTPAAPLLPLVDAADTLLAALVDLDRAARAEGVEPPRELAAQLGLWALRQRCIRACAICATGLLVSDGRRPALCPEHVEPSAGRWGA